MSHPNSPCPPPLPHYKNMEHAKGTKNTLHLHLQQKLMRSTVREPLLRKIHAYNLSLSLSCSKTVE